MRPSGASPSPGLAKTSALVHTWIQKGSIPRLTSWRSVISLSTTPPCTYHLLSIHPLQSQSYILSCLPNPQIWSRGLCSPTSRACGCLQVSHSDHSPPFRGIARQKWEKAQNKTPIPPQEKAERCMNFSDTSSESIATPIAIDCCRSRDPTPQSEQQGQGLRAYRPITNPNHTLNHTFDHPKSNNFQSLIYVQKPIHH